jgi:hypothetical protein
MTVKISVKVGKKLGEFFYFVDDNFENNLRNIFDGKINVERMMNLWLNFFLNDCYTCKLKVNVCKTDYFII